MEMDIKKLREMVDKTALLMSTLTTTLAPAMSEQWRKDMQLLVSQTQTLMDQLERDMQNAAAEVSQVFAGDAQGMHEVMVEHNQELQGIAKHAEELGNAIMKNFDAMNSQLSLADLYLDIPRKEEGPSL